MIYFNLILMEIVSIVAEYLGQTVYNTVLSIPTKQTGAYNGGILYSTIMIYNLY